MSLGIEKLYVIRIYDFYINDNGKIVAEKITVHRYKKKNSRKPLVTLCYGVEVPRDVDHAFCLDEE